MFGLLARAKAVKKRTLSHAHLNIELAKLEGKQKATVIGTGAGLAAGAGVLLVYAIGFAFAALAAGLSETVSLWLSLLIVAGILFLAAAIEAVNVADSFYRSGALVFGGGHVVLPLLESQVVDSGWVTEEQFLEGYGAVQAVPGPLFTFSAYLGAVMEPEPNGVAGATLALIFIFLPAFFITVGVLPLWGVMQSRPGLQAGLYGVNAAVVGILLAALYTPVFTSAIDRPADFALAVAAFGALALWKVPPWLVVLLTSIGGALIGVS